MKNSCELKPWVWWRFLDDVFMIWLYGGDELSDFLARKFSVARELNTMYFIYIYIYIYIK